MRDIYRRAQGVQVLLGEDEEDSKKAFDLIDRLHGTSRNDLNACNTRSISYMAPLERTEFLGLTASIKDMFYIEAPIVAFHSMIERAWFSQIWVVQEVAQAQSA
jgi:hypothetical protein